MKRGEIEAWIQNTGIKKENVLYYLWDIFRDAEEWIPFALPEDALPSATKAGEYFATVGCIASTDTNSQAWRCESAIRSVSNKSFTIYYPPAEPALNARAKIANIPNAQGFTFTVAIHPAPSNGSLPDGCRPLKVLVIRARVWT
ncbi:MAG: hypothetical protein LBT57_01175, partial [Puniceicoccales bacterium]|nr:hypothetical protein [Puniceicoccales bacterium]